MIGPIVRATLSCVISILTLPAPSLVIPLIIRPIIRPINCVQRPIVRPIVRSLADV